MKLSTKGRYGVRAMFDLAKNHGQGPITLKSIAERQDISEHYLEQLMASLRKANLVKVSAGHMEVTCWPVNLKISLLVT